MHQRGATISLVHATHRGSSGGCCLQYAVCLHAFCPTLHRPKKTRASHELNSYRHMTRRHMLYLTTRSQLIKRSRKENTTKQRHLKKQDHTSAHADPHETLKALSRLKKAAQHTKKHRHHMSSINTYIRITCPYMLPPRRRSKHSSVNKTPHNTH